MYRDCSPLQAIRLQDYRLKGERFICLTYVDLDCLVFFTSASVTPTQFKHLIPMTRYIMQGSGNYTPEPKPSSSTCISCSIALKCCTILCRLICHIIIIINNGCSAV